MTYAIIKLGGKQHRVREGEWLLVDREPTPGEAAMLAETVEQTPAPAPAPTAAAPGKS